MKKSDLALSLPQRILLMVCIFILGYIITMVVSYLLGRVLSDNLAGAVRISAVVQDVFTFILPAVATALLVTRKPAELLHLTTKPRATSMLWIVALLFVSIPALETVIYWNYHISLPESMAAFEQLARQLEDAASGTLKAMLANTSVANLIVNILIVGVFAGLAEELLFRGCFLRLLTTGGVNKHLAVWLVAICFSALHFQLFGFVPRVLLGAYFGYLLIWTRSVWAPITAHVLNNTMFVISAWLDVRANGVETFTDEPTLWAPAAIILSAVLTANVLYLLWRSRE